MSAPSTTPAQSQHQAPIWARQAMWMTVISAVVTSACLAAYDRLVAMPSRRLGVVDLAAIYHAKEDEYARAFYKASASVLAGGSGAPVASAGSAAPALSAHDLAQDFARRLPYALEDLRRECRCVIVVRGAVATLGEGMVDLTPALRGKLGMQP